MKMSDKQIVIVSFDDWMGIYVDRKRVYWSDFINTRNVFDALGIECERWWYEAAEVMDVFDLEELPPDWRDTWEEVGAYCE
jgi:hypothetical protein